MTISYPRLNFPVRSLARHILEEMGNKYKEAAQYT